METSADKAEKISIGGGISQRGALVGFFVNLI